MGVTYGGVEQILATLAKSTLAGQPNADRTGAPALAQGAEDVAQGTLADERRKALAKKAAEGQTSLGGGLTDAGSGALTGAAAGASIGSAFPGIGTAIGAGVGALSGAILGGVAGSGVAGSTGSSAASLGLEGLSAAGSLAGSAGAAATPSNTPAMQMPAQRQLTIGNVGAPGEAPDVTTALGPSVSLNATPPAVPQTPATAAAPPPTPFAQRFQTVLQSPAFQKAIQAGQAAIPPPAMKVPSVSTPGLHPDLAMKVDEQFHQQLLAAATLSHQNQQMQLEQQRVGQGQQGLDIQRSELGQKTDYQNRSLGLEQQKVLDEGRHQATQEALTSRGQDIQQQDTRESIAERAQAAKQMSMDRQTSHEDSVAARQESTANRSAQLKMHADELAANSYGMEPTTGMLYQKTPTGMHFMPPPPEVASAIKTLQAGKANDAQVKTYGDAASAASHIFPGSSDVDSALRMDHIQGLSGMYTPGQYVMNKQGDIGKVKTLTKTLTPADVSVVTNPTELKDAQARLEAVKARLRSNSNLSQSSQPSLGGIGVNP